MRGLAAYPEAESAKRSQMACAEYNVQTRITAVGSIATGAAQNLLVASNAILMQVHAQNVKRVMGCQAGNALPVLKQAISGATGRLRARVDRPIAQLRTQPNLLARSVRPATSYLVGAVSSVERTSTERMERPAQPLQTARP